MRRSFVDQDVLNGMSWAKVGYTPNGAVGVNMPVDDIGLLVKGICATLPEVGCLWSSVIMMDSLIACAMILPDDVLIVKMTLKIVSFHSVCSRRSETY